MFFKGKSPVTPDQVLEALSHVQDPDLNKDIVTLGFIKNLVISDANAVTFTVELTTPACPVREQLKAQCEERVRAIPGVTAATATMTATVRSAGPSSAPGDNRLKLPTVKNVIAVASGKGGVGKSTVTINLAVAMAKTGARVGLLDADIYGPSVPLMMGTREERPFTDGRNTLFPIEKNGILMMSMGYLVPESEAVVWRGPRVHAALVQFLTQVAWGELDYLFIDMPPGTGDAQLTISQLAPLAGTIIVTTPQEVSLIDARKGLQMFRGVKVPVLGVVENMAGFVCGHCKELTPIFRAGGGARIAAEYEAPLLGSVPIEASIAESGDLGTPLVEAFPDSRAAAVFRDIAGKVAQELSKRSASGSSYAPLSLEWSAT